MKIKGKEVKAMRLIIPFGVLLGVLTSLFVVEDRWNQQPGLLAAEKNVVKTFQMFQTKQETVTKILQVQLLNIQYDNLNERYYRLRKEVRDNPEDLFLIEELNRTKAQIKKIAEQRTELLK